MGGVARIPGSRYIATGASLLQEVSADCTEFSVLVAFCGANEVPVPSYFVEALPLIQGWFSQGQDSLAAVRQAEEATVAEGAKTAALSRIFVDYKDSTDSRIMQLD